jgi:hypothetical protein
MRTGAAPAQGAEAVVVKRPEAEPVGGAATPAVAAEHEHAGLQGLQLRRARFLVFHVTQALLVLQLLVGSVVLLMFRGTKLLEVQRQALMYASDAVAITLAVLTVVPTVVWSVSERVWPTWWMWADFLLALLVVLVSAVMLGVESGDFSNFIASHVLTSTCVGLITGFRLYVRQVIDADVAHSRWHELHVGTKSARVSSFVITYKACAVLLRALPWSNALFLLLALVAAAQSPLAATLVAMALSAPQQAPPGSAQLGSGITIGWLCLVILAGQLSTLALSVLTARIFSRGSALLQRQLALKAVYGGQGDSEASDESPGRLTSTFSQGLAKVQALWISGTSSLAWVHVLLWLVRAGTGAGAGAGLGCLPALLASC